MRDIYVRVSAPLILQWFQSGFRCADVVRDALPADAVYTGAIGDYSGITVMFSSEQLEDGPDPLELEPVFETPATCRHVLVKAD